MASAVTDAVADELAIRHVLTSYARAIDRLDMDLLRTVYHPDAFEDHGAYQGDLDGFISWLEGVLPRFSVTQHFLGNTHIELEGDVAHVETYCQAFHRFPTSGSASEDDFVLGARYIDRFERRDGEWRIARRKLVVDWSQTASAAPRPGAAADFESGRRDRTDAVYHFGRD